jgi:hypothetical protein
MPETIIIPIIRDGVEIAQLELTPDELAMLEQHQLESWYGDDSDDA